MNKTTLYLPDKLKDGVRIAARQNGESESEFIRAAIRARLAVQEPRFGFISLGENVAERVDEILAEKGFGEG